MSVYGMKDSPMIFAIISSIMLSLLQLAGRAVTMLVSSTLAISSANPATFLLITAIFTASHATKICPASKAGLFYGSNHGSAYHPPGQHIFLSSTSGRTIFFSRSLIMHRHRGLAATSLRLLHNGAHRFLCLIHQGPLWPELLQVNQS